MSKSYQIANKYISKIKSSKTFNECLNKMKLISCEEGKLRCEFKITESELNTFGSMHGGFTATVTDVLTSVALLSQNPNNIGVSVNLNMNYHRPALLGSEVVCDATLQKLGKQMAYMEMIITDKKTGKLLATGNHTKFLADISDLTKYKLDEP